VLERDGKISWTDTVKNTVLQRVKEEGNILSTVNRRQANWTGHVVRSCVGTEL